MLSIALSFTVSIQAQEIDAAGQETAPVLYEDAVETETPLIIVIDPGHGGTGKNGAPEGGVYDDFVEKDMTLITAMAMKEELEKYEGVEVYLTREGDQKLTLQSL